MSVCVCVLPSLANSTKPKPFDLPFGRHDTTAPTALCGLNAKTCALASATPNDAKQANEGTYRPSEPRWWCQTEGWRQTRSSRSAHAPQPAPNICIGTRWMLTTENDREIISRSLSRKRRRKNKPLARLARHPRRPRPRRRDHDDDAGCVVLVYFGVVWS